MGVLTEIYAAYPSDADQLKNDPNRTKKWKGIDAKGHNEITLSALWSILDSTVDIDDAVEKFELLTEDDSDGPWVYLAPHAFAELLAELNETNIDEIHKLWIEHEELRRDVSSEEDARCVRETLKALAAIAKERGDTSILMWQCL